MAHFLREVVARKILEKASIINNGVLSQTEWPIVQDRLPCTLQFTPVAKQRKLRSDKFFPPHMVIDIDSIRKSCLQNVSKPESAIDLIREASRMLQDDSQIAKVKVKDYHIEFDVEQNLLVKDCLSAIVQDSNYGFSSHYHKWTKGGDGFLVPLKQPQTIVMDYSSPNIAKPFHAGHLRSTILGNVIGNLYERLGHSVIRINYLGNWGTQFGLLAVGYNKYGSMEKLNENALQHLSEVYVKINAEASDNKNILEAAHIFSNKLEDGDKESVTLWKQFMDSSLTEYNKTYKRLGIRFTVVDSEANQVERSKCIIQTLQEKGFLETNPEGLKYVPLNVKDSETMAVVARQDGSSVYLSRDIAAAVERHEKYTFDRIHYFVETGQHHHFYKLQTILQKLGYGWASCPLEEFHVKFGRIRGMSTRSGNVILLSDLLERTQLTMLNNMKNTETSKQIENENEVAEILGQSGLIIQDLKQRRVLDYEFSWERMLSSKGDTGVALQYSHARLSNIEKYCGVPLETDCDITHLVEPSAINLVCHLAKYDEVLNKTLSDLEPCHLVLYLFLLARVSNVAVCELRVKGEEDLRKAKARLLLFHCAKLVLNSGLQTLGIQPLNEF